MSGYFTTCEKRLDREPGNEAIDDDIIDVMYYCAEMSLARVFQQRFRFIHIHIKHCRMYMLGE